MNIVKATAKYEAWLATHLKIVEKDLAFKHEQMRLAPFPFMRATYYRWAQLFPEVCEEIFKAPATLAVGDLHVENFGTWRDIEGRLIWGINDFDEASTLPYTNDLVRLGASALMSNLVCEPEAGLEALLQGYIDAIQAGGRPFALAEHHTALRAMATARLHDPEAYWAKLRALPLAASEPPAGALKAIARMMPERGLQVRITTRIAGLGSLGRQRYVAIADWHGGGVAREAKALAPSACLWAKQGKGTAPIHYQEILRTAIRCRDPFVSLQKRWIVRRLAPDCSRISLGDLPQQRDEMRLLRAMGWETANIHLGNIKPRTLLTDLKKRPRRWLFKAARAMEKAVLADYADFRDHSTR
uniref:DUF2252 domain-containing protein n=1 Tax=Solibacter usitatus (strain Ellin6076) TaxID=234267 RepID=Q01RV9_SOLUE